VPRLLHTYLIYGVASKFRYYGLARSDPDVWIGLDHLPFGMDRGYGSACGFRVWIGALHFDSQPCAMCVRLTSKYDTDQYNTNMFHRFRTDCFNIVLVCFSFLWLIRLNNFPPLWNRAETELLPVVVRTFLSWKAVDICLPNVHCGAR